MRFITFDTETTGVDVYNDRIVTAFIGVYDSDNEPENPFVQSYPWRQAHKYLFNPAYSIAEEASAVHGITNEVAEAQGSDPAEGVLDIYTKLRSYSKGFTLPVVIYNAPFDLTILDVELKRYGHKVDLRSEVSAMAEPFIVDPMVIDGFLDPWRKGKRTLSAVAEALGVPVIDAHDASADCLMAGRIARKLLNDEKMLPSVIRGEYGSLLRAQQDWKKEKIASQVAYFKSRGTDTSGFDDGFPFRALPRE